MTNRIYDELTEKIILTIIEDENLQEAAINFMKQYTHEYGNRVHYTCNCYEAFIQFMGLEKSHCDGTHWLDKNLDYRYLDRFMEDIFFSSIKTNIFKNWYIEEVGIKQEYENRIKKRKEALLSGESWQPKPDGRTKQH